MEYDGVRRIRGCSAVSLAGVGQYHHCSQQIKRPIGPATPHWSPGRWRLVGSVSVLYLWTPTQKVESEERRSSCASERRTSTCFGPLLTCQHAWSLLWPPSSCRQSFHCPCSGLTARGSSPYRLRKNWVTTSASAALPYFHRFRGISRFFPSIFPITVSWKSHRDPSLFRRRQAVIGSNDRGLQGMQD